MHCRNFYSSCKIKTKHSRIQSHWFFFQTKPICFCLSATTCNCSVHNLAVLRLRRCVAAKLIDDKNTNASCSHVNVVAAVSQWYVYPHDMCIPTHISLVIISQVSPPKMAASDLCIPQPLLQIAISSFKAILSSGCLLDEQLTQTDFKHKSQFL